jgi:hypothetical protein
LKTKSIVLMIALLAGIIPLAFSQSKDTGSIEGTVTDQEKAPLPGVTVTLSSPNLMGTRTEVTGADGLYRFPALPPGVYEVKAQIQGFKTYIRENVRVQTTMRLAIDIPMTQSTVEEEVTVVAQSPTVDVKSTETASVTLSNDILRNIPYNQFAANIVNMAPGVTSNVAYGASQSTGIAYTMDGVNVADPEGGSSWVFVDHNIIEEAKIMALGLPAEYGNFTGVIFNMITKSGGNNFSGHMEADFQGKKGDWPKGLWQTNNNQKYVQDFPKLTSPLLKLYDISAHLGGPIKKDKIWFYVGLQYYRSMEYPTGFPEALDYKEPRSFFKLTAQLSPSTPVSLSVEIDTYNGTNRGGNATTLPEATVTQKSPEVVANFSLTHIFSPKTFFDVKAAYFWGYYYLEPVNGRDVNSHYDIAADLYAKNATYFYMADRTRFQANATLTHYAEDFIQGNHDFKFGVELERSWARSRYGYPGANHTNYADYPGYYYAGPQGQYLAYQYQGYDTNTSLIRVEAFVQDAWQIAPRLNIGLGLRFSNNWGFVKGKDGSVFHDMRLAPRIGFTFDVLGDKTTILKGHYGQYTEAMFTGMVDRLNPPSAFSDSIVKLWNNATNEFEVIDVVPPVDYRLTDGIKHPYMNQFTASIERELFKDASFTIVYINRKWKDFIFRYDKATTWDPFVFHSTDLNKDITVYDRTSARDSHDLWIQNGVPGRKTFRKYWGLEFVFNKRFSNKWQLLASYVYSKATGNVNNSFGGDIGWQGSMDNPNRWINAEGNLTYDPTHMAKVQTTYLLPWGIYFNAFFRAITGNSWTTSFRSSSLPFTGSRTSVFAETRGSNHYPLLTALDVRLEKTFLLAAKYRLGVIVDVFNVFNTDTITSWGVTYGSGSDWKPSSTYPSTDGHRLLGLQTPRQARVGIRLIF